MRLVFVVGVLADLPEQFQVGQPVLWGEWWREAESGGEKWKEVGREVKNDGQRRRAARRKRGERDQIRFRLI